MSQSPTSTAIDLTPMRDGQRGAVNALWDNVRGGRQTTGIVLPTRYGKSDVIKMGGLGLLLDNLVGRDRVRALVASRVDGMGVGPDEYSLIFRVVGKDSVMGEREPVREVLAHELGVIMEAVAPTQELANEILGLARQAGKNLHYDGKLCDEGCLTFPHSPSDIPTGPVYQYNILHAVEPDNPLEMFPIEYVTV